MEVSIYTIAKIGFALRSVSKESPLTKVAKNEFEAAMARLETIKEESTIREGLNSTLCHLESAFFNYSPSTLDVWDRDRVLWDKKTFKNTICLLISIIHYLLGNDSIARKWIEERLDDMGSINFPSELIPCLQLANDAEYYKRIGCYEKVKAIKSASETNWYNTYRPDDDPMDDPFFYSMCHYD